MEQYIPKSVVLAEIEKLIDEIYAGRPFDALSSGQQTALWYIKSIMSSINTFEVTEVDLEKELDSMITPELKFHKALPSLFDVAKHFFELGMKMAQKGE